MENQCAATREFADKLRQARERGGSRCLSDFTVSEWKSEAFKRR